MDPNDDIKLCGTGKEIMRCGTRQMPIMRENYICETSAICVKNIVQNNI